MRQAHLDCRVATAPRNFDRSKFETASGAKQSIGGISGLRPNSRGWTVRLAHCGLPRRTGVLLAISILFSRFFCGNDRLPPAVSMNTLSSNNFENRNRAEKSPARSDAVHSQQHLLSLATFFCRKGTRHRRKRLHTDRFARAVRTDTSASRNSICHRSPAPSCQLCTRRPCSNPRSLNRSASIPSGRFRISRLNISNIRPCRRAVQIRRTFVRP